MDSDLSVLNAASGSVRSDGIFHLAAVQADPLMNPYANAQLPGAMPGQPQDFGKLFKAERDNLALADGLYKWAGADVELRVLRKYGRIPS